jgi:hypothetical protein
MPSRWKIAEKDSPSPSLDEFDEFVDLYKAYLGGKTADPVKLRGRVNRKWENLTMAQKRAFTGKLIEVGLIDKKAIEVIKIFDGVIWEF